MVRAGLQGRRIGEGPRASAPYAPAASVVAASFLSALPIVSDTGWYPDVGFLLLIAWRLLRSDVWPSWWAAPLGLVNDLLTGTPIGFSVTLWTAAMLFIELVERRTVWRDYWVDWGLAALLLFAYEAAEWRVAQMMEASLPFLSIFPPFLIAVFAYPIAAGAVARIDRWRLNG